MSTQQFRINSDNALAAEISSLRERIVALEGRSSGIPILEADPPVGTPITMWMLADGRLRSRRADGVVMEYATTTPKSASSFEPLPDPGYLPGAGIYSYNSSWQRSFKAGGSTIHDNPPGRLYYGFISPSNGEFKSMIGFPNLSELAPGVDGIDISSVSLFLDNRYTYLASGAVVRIGIHNASTAPSTFNQVGSIVAEIQVPYEGSGWYELPLSVGEALSAGTAKGITLNQNSSNPAMYGYADSAKLRITYYK